MISIEIMLKPAYMYPAGSRLAVLFSSVLLGWCVVLPAAGSVVVTDSELKCYRELGAQTVPTQEIRKHATELLAGNPNSFVVPYVLGGLDAKTGNWPSAIRNLQAARRRLELIPGHRDAPTGADPAWYAIVLNELADAYDGMDRLGEAESVWQVLSGLSLAKNTIPDFTGKRIGSLLKGGRVQEAADLVARKEREPGLTDAEKLDLRIYAARVQFAQEPDGAAAYAAFSGIVADGRRLRGQWLPLTEFAFHARRQGDYQKARAALLESASMINTTSATHPWWTLADLDVAAGRWADANADIRHCWDWLEGKERNVRAELWADTSVRVAQYYLAIGCPERAERLLLPLVRHPIRSGYSSRPIQQWEAGVVLAAWSASRQVRTLEIAAAVEKSIFTRMLIRIRQLPRRWSEALLARRVRMCVVSQIDAGLPIRDCFMPVDAPVWMWSDLASVLGKRELRRLVDAYPLRGRQKEMFQDAIEAEMAFHHGQWSDTIEHGQAALSVLPADESLLRGRVQVMVGESLRHLGRNQEARPHLAACVENAPASFLALGARVPVEQPIDEFRPWLSRSPVLRSSEQGFIVSLIPEGLRLKPAGPGTAGGTVLRTFAHKGESPPGVSAYVVQRAILSPVPLPSEDAALALEGGAASARPEKKARM